MFEEKKTAQTWFCTKCGNDNSPESVFCEFCGNAKPVDPAKELQKKMAGAAKFLSQRISAATGKRLCPNCKNICSAEETFCPACGTKLDDAKGDLTPMQEIVPLEEPKAQKVTCVHCGAVNPDYARFCSECGKEVRVKTEIANESAGHIIENRCPECGNIQPSGNSFCNACGAKMEQAYQQSR